MTHLAVSKVLSPGWNLLYHRHNRLNYFDYLIWLQLIVTTKSEYEQMNE